MKRSEIESLLPDVYQRSIKPGTALFAILDVMEGLHAPSERVLNQMDSYFNPNTAPDSFVRYLAEWVDLDRYLADESSTDANTGKTSGGSIEPGRLRALTSLASYLSQWRGTAKGLKLFLETATGINGFSLEEEVQDENNVPRVFHFRIKVPQAAARYQNLITRIINGEKPAYVTYELEIVLKKEGEAQ